MKIVKLTTWNNRVDAEQAETLVKGKGMQIADARTLQKITADDKLWEEYEDCFPCRSGTKISYKEGASTAIIQHPGEKPKKIKFPLNDGYYKVGKDGIPNGAISDSSDKKARYLSRWQDRDYEGLVVRGYGYFGDNGRRYVFCDYGASGRFGVLGTNTKKHKHVWKKICEICGERK